MKKFFMFLSFSLIFTHLISSDSVRAHGMPITQYERLDSNPTQGVISIENDNPQTIHIKCFNTYGLISDGWVSVPQYRFNTCGTLGNHASRMTVNLGCTGCENMVIHRDGCGEQYAAKLKINEQLDQGSLVTILNCKHFKDSSHE